MKIEKGVKINNYRVVRKIRSRIISGEKRSVWLCRCGCGREFELLQVNMRKTKSCGCKRSKNATGYKGIIRLTALGSKKNPFRAMYKKVYIGVFASIAEAVAARNEYKLLNNIDESE